MAEILFRDKQRSKKHDQQNGYIKFREKKKRKKNLHDTRIQIADLKVWKGSNFSTNCRIEFFFFFKFFT